MTTSTPPDAANAREAADATEAPEGPEAGDTAGTAPGGADSGQPAGGSAGSGGTGGAGGIGSGGASGSGGADATPEAADGDGDGDDVASRVWRGLRLVVLERHEGRKEVVEALGMSFFRIKALRRIAARPSRLSELAAELGSDRPYLTLVVDDLLKRGLVERDRDPADRRSKIVTATAEGRAVAARANAILGTPPRCCARCRPATWPSWSGSCQP
ncbi:MarR family transcriptional regulator [Actinacidiphila sp. DG2A-62]|uniref:MarR family winged helix-turn-helix transcriptional regulator n=1 Tax=Actinacidiphila sp. DG2A-62 TaxID=3108821 RepID=UPI002DBE9A91|nr:MarR family transcriptional regulator [Actinacidiphila sp. DG2A-62]MEC3994139.1 MarR family transcriptional regulator [Actinacidiphila sp. DG2A-62]